MHIKVISMTLYEFPKMTKHFLTLVIRGYVEDHRSVWSEMWRKGVEMVFCGGGVGCGYVCVCVCVCFLY